MNIFETFLIALGLSMDSLAIAIAYGVMPQKHRLINALRCGLCFGLMQMIMPLIGWLAGTQLRQVIEGVDHWVAFIILMLIGLKMISDSRQTNENVHKKRNFRVTTLLCLGLATSIDALAVGIGLAFLQINIITTALVIGGVTLLVSFAGVLIGGVAGIYAEKKVTLMGGLILIFIGLKILLEHTLY
ncbi:manganese efflux pump MntP family protein [Patescibacteria group bacterium]|nr:manganese efflux pump MntP family protein [Patescibacteria group bacterium]